MNNAGLSAHHYQRPALPAFPHIAPYLEAEILPQAGPKGLSCLDNGSAYVAQAYQRALTQLGLRHLRTKPYRPRTNGKACVLGWRCRPLGRRGSPHLLV